MVQFMEEEKVDIQIHLIQEHIFKEMLKLILVMLEVKRAQQLILQFMVVQHLVV